MSVESNVTITFSADRQRIAAWEYDLPTFVKRTLGISFPGVKKVEIENAFSIDNFEPMVRGLCEHIARVCPDDGFKVSGWIEHSVDGYTVDLDLRYEDGVLEILKWEYSGCMRFDVDHQNCVECDCDITDLVKTGKPFLCENCGVSYAPCDYEFEDDDMSDEIEYFYTIDPPVVTVIVIKEGN